MAILPMTKDKVMRPSLIDSVDKINEIIIAVNLLDPAEIEAIESRVDALESAVTSINTRLDNIAQSLVTINASIATMSSDIDNIKVTLYTPLSGNGGN